MGDQCSEDARIRDVQRLYDARLREVRFRFRIDRAVQVAIAVGPALLLVSLVVCVLALTGESCERPVLADSGEGTHRSESAPSAAIVAAPQAPLTSAGELASRMQRWQPTWRERHAGELAEVAGAIVDGCARAPWPAPDRCVALTTALAFRESSFRVTAVGARGEIGLLQIMGAALQGETRETAADPQRNVELGLRWLAASAEVCRIAGWSGRPDFEERVLSKYAGLSCVPSRGARLVLRWAGEL